MSGKMIIISVVFALILAIGIGICYVSGQADAMGERPPEKTSTTVVTTATSLPVRPKDKIDTTPPSEVGNLKIENVYDEGRKIRLSWENPPEDDFYGVIIIVRSDRYPEHAKDIEGDGKLLINLMERPNEEQSYIHSRYYPPWMRVVFRDPDQYYLIVTYDRAGNYSKGIKGFLRGMVI